MQQVIITETKNAQPLGAKPILSLKILGRHFRPVMNFTIQLHDQTGFRTIEIDDVITELVLTAELHAAKLSVSEKFP